MPNTPQLDQSSTQNSIPKNTGIEGLQERHAYLETQGKDLSFLKGDKKLENPADLRGNIENYIGMAQVPVGLAGPLLIHGKHAKGSFSIPLATTEGALVASYSRGMRACSEAGGVTSLCVNEAVQRSPFFKFDTVHTALDFAIWVEGKQDVFEEIVSQTSRFAKLQSIKTLVEGNTVIVTFGYETGDASGQNMVTICSDKLCKYILATYAHKPSAWYVESNYSGDKKATAVSFTSVRGKKVLTEVNLPEEVVKNILRTSPQALVDCWKAAALASIQTVSIGAQGHVANGLAALFIACGQDAACVAESAVGVTRMELDKDGGVYASLTLPALMVGTVGGGTHLPTQNECLQILDCAGANKAKKLAEICGAVALAGELSICAAMSADHFTSAHKIFGRKK